MIDEKKTKNKAFTADIKCKLPLFSVSETILTSKKKKTVKRREFSQLSKRKVSRMKTPT